MTDHNCNNTSEVQYHVMVFVSIFKDMEIIFNDIIMFNVVLSQREHMIIEACFRNIIALFELIKNAFNNNNSNLSGV